ncbi:TPM domain-containing protein [Coleofasciculus chthonoplastes]|uniref:TPM domain-containing protein n=1 Tax=Coleofasciculus chthonoplastes TaxID=64178 RepID=UPI0032FD01D0
MKVFKLQRLVVASLFCLALCLFPYLSYALNIQDVPNPQQVNGTWVTDMANILSDSTETKLNQMISELEAQNGTEIAVVTVPETAPLASPKAFTTELFNHWGIGKANEDNGVLFLVSVGDRRVEIETGYGIEPILPDAQVGHIIENKITPRFKQGDFDGGVLAGTKALVKILQGKNTHSFSANPTDISLAEISLSATHRGRIALMGVVGILLSWIGYRQFKKISNPIYLTPTGRSRVQQGYTPERKAYIFAYLVTFSATFALVLFSVAITPLANIGVFIGIIVTSLAIGCKLLKLAINKLHSRYKTTNRSTIIIFIIFAILTGFWSVILGVLILIPFIPIFFVFFVQSIIGYLMGYLFGQVGVIISSALISGAIIAIPLSHRFMERYYSDPSLRCNSCHLSLRKVKSSLVASQLTKPEKVAQELGSVRFEGWHCRHCSQKMLLRLIHIRAYVLDSQSYQKCPHCQELTVTRREAMIPYSLSQRFIIDECKCCDYSQEQAVIIQRSRSYSGGSSSRSRSSSSSYSGSYGSYSGSTGSSGSSSSSSSGSFDGGSSGGGGAGGSW